MTKSVIVQEVKDYFFIALGIVIYSMGVTLFMLPYGLTSGGVGGISAIVYYATGFEIQNTYIIINALLLVAAIKVLGLKFCIKTIYGVVVMTFFLWLLQRLVEVPDPENPAHKILPKLIGPEAYFMACVLGAIVEGVGLTFCFENNGSTGGTDIIAAIVNKYKNMSLGTVLMCCDIIIISSCYFIFHDWFRVIYGYVMLVICSFTLDYCMNRRHQSVQFLIFSRNPEPIANAINETHHGVTLLEGEGWYTHTERKVILSIIRKREQAAMLRMIKRIDPYAFVSMSMAGGVWGEGFDKIKVSENKILKSNIPISQYLKENAASFHKLTLPETFEIILKENKISKAQAVKGSDLERTHGYQILSGKRNPTRDSLLRMCIGMRASSEQTRILLLKIKAAPLYSKDKRDSVILFGILHHMNLQGINELLYQNRLPILGK